MHILAIIVSAVVAMIIGYVWYSPYLFGNVFMKLTCPEGMSPEKTAEMKKKAMPAYGVQFITTLITAAVLSFVVGFADVTFVPANLFFVFVAWVAFGFPVAISSVLWENKSIKLFLLNAGYTIVSLAVMTIVLTLW